MYIPNSLVYIPRDYEVKKDNAKSLDFLIEKISSENINIEEVVEENKDEILNYLPLEKYKNFDYDLFKDLLIIVLKKQIEKNQQQEESEVIDDKYDGDYDRYLEDMEDNEKLMDSFDYSVDTGVIYTDEDNSFRAIYENFVDDGYMTGDNIPPCNSYSEPDYDFEPNYGYDYESYYEPEPEDYMDIPEDYHLEHITTLEEVLKEYDMEFGYLERDD